MAFRNRIIGLSIIAVFMVAAIPFARALSQEVFYDQARVISVEPVYEFNSAPVTGKQCSDIKNESERRSTDNSAKGLVKALRGDAERFDIEEPIPTCRTITRHDPRKEIVAYAVRYEYGSEIYERRMDRRPGHFVRVRVRLDPHP